MVEGTMFSKRAVLLAIVVAALGVHANRSALAQNWVGSWVGTWTPSPQPPRGAMPASFSNQTVRQVVRVSIGGSKVRIRLSNEFGSKPVLIGAASVGLAGKSAEIVAGSLRSLTFGGAKEGHLAAGSAGLERSARVERRATLRPCHQSLLAGGSRGRH